MFNLPSVKRVCREDVYRQTSPSPPSPPSPPPPPLEPSYEDGHIRLGKLLNLDIDALHRITDDFSEGTNRLAEPKALETSTDTLEEEFEFRLFGSSAQTADDDPGRKLVKKIRVSFDSPAPGPAHSGQGGFVRPFRGWEHYFTTPMLLTSPHASVWETSWSGNTNKKAQFEDSAVTGEDIIQWARSQAWPGCHLPWRVIHFKRGETKFVPNTIGDTFIIGHPIETEPKSRKKPGKKRRIQLRKRAAAAAAAAERAKETDAEKRNRKNRERKINRRRKAREMKAAACQAAEPAEIDKSPGQEP